ncbi:MAG: TetR family transcriptional regulator C-terminal domain-containing protein [Sedimenticola sp.]
MVSAQPLKRRRGRPQKNQTGVGNARERLLQSGVEILTEKGFSATGIDEILRRVNVPKGSFYHYFSSKDAFGTELIKRYADYFAHKLDIFLKDETLPPLERIRAFIADAEAGMARYEFKRGCLVGNLGQEMGSLPEQFREQLNAVFEAWQSRVEACLEAAIMMGQLAPDADCKKLAEVFWIGWEGAVLRAKLEKSPKPLRSFTDFYFAAMPS